MLQLQKSWSFQKGLPEKGQRDWIGSSAKKVIGLPGELCNADLGTVE